MVDRGLGAVGAYADIWSELRSMAYALEQLFSSQGKSLSPLDQDRLLALIRFIRVNLQTSPDSRSLLLRPHATSGFFVLPLLRDRVLGTATASGVSPEQLEAAVANLEAYLKGSVPLFPQKAPLDGLEALRSLLAELVSQAESALPA